ncbi:hypothetical protein [Streptomyces sp. NPDC054797]
MPRCSTRITGSRAVVPSMAATAMSQDSDALSSADECPGSVDPSKVPKVS